MSEIAWARSVSSTDETHTGDTNWASYSAASLSSGDFTAGHKYLLLVSANVTSDAGTDNMGCRVIHGSTSFADSEVFRNPTAGDLFAYNWFTVWTAVASEGIAVQMKTFNAARTVTLDAVQIIAIDLNELTEGTQWEYAEDGTDQALSSSAWTLGARATISANGSDTWMLLSYGQYDVTAALGTAVRMEMEEGGSIVGSTQQRLIPRDTGNQLALFGLTTLTPSNGSHSYDEASRDTNDDQTRIFSRIFALNLAVFRNSAVAVTTGSINPAATFTEVQTATLDPDITPGNVLCLGYCHRNVGGDGGNTGIFQYQIDTNNIGGQNTSLEYMTDGSAADEVSIAKFGIFSFSASRHFDVDCKEGSNTNLTITDRYVVMVTMELEGGGPKQFEYSPDLTARSIWEVGAA